MVRCPTFKADTCTKICLNAVESLRGEDGKQMYKLDKVYDNLHLEYWQNDHAELQLIRREYPLYKLGDQYAPF